MHITIVAAGRHKAGPLKALEQFYAERIRWPLAIREIEERRKLPPAELKLREAELILAAMPKDAILVALDGRGKAFSSADFAQRFARWREADAALAFAIGGADGLAESVTDRAKLVLSLGAMTWPHLMVRGMLLEQIYRAQQILAGHPYHRA
ncbi:MAG TPA: 23S rRNA (pseudouridine(1915)-N(3))-methyltransferase RlmH [Stellaceae bacterium]|nr:23S rRNA (pseudouridine(1915)-N(3))-methyltransferase RlmH [Stellaceae bacterium]